LTNRRVSNEAKIETASLPVTQSQADLLLYVLDCVRDAGYIHTEQVQDYLHVLANVIDVQRELDEKHAAMVREWGEP
jgi:hypothetical protein